MEFLLGLWPQEFYQKMIYIWLIFITCSITINAVWTQKPKDWIYICIGIPIAILILLGLTVTIGWGVNQLGYPNLANVAALAGLMWFNASGRRRNRKLTAIFKNTIMCFKVEEFLGMVVAPLWLGFALVMQLAYGITS